MTKTTIAQTAIAAALKDLADAAQLSKDVPHAVSCVCAAVANLIAGAGTFGGGAQVKMMDAASAAGFQPEYYAGSIRVSWGMK